MSSSPPGNDTASFAVEKVVRKWRWGCCCGGGERAKWVRERDGGGGKWVVVMRKRGTDGEDWVWREKR